MKLMSHRLFDLSFGALSFLAPAVGLAQMEGYPIPMEMGGPTAPMSYPMPACDDACDGCGPINGGDGCGSYCFDPRLGQRYGEGCGFGDKGGSGCGPLGCNGGTFGDGRDLSALLSCIAAKICGFGKALITPYGEGGVASQRWFDISAEALALRRDNGAGNFLLTSQGRESGVYVLDTDSVDFDDYELGLGLQLNFQTGPGSNLEVAYFGLNEWEESASVSSSTPTLYSFFSDFGAAPPGGFDDSDRSFTHSINYESTLNNGEVNFRRRWAEPSGFFQGSWLAGVRYFDLDENATFTARGEDNDTSQSNGPRFFNYDTRTNNQMTGFQVGGDLWANLIPGIKVGTEIKAGIYGNHAVQSTQIFANSVPGSNNTAGFVDERASDGRTAYLVQASTHLVYRLSYSWALRGSGQLIYIDNVALAAENFNPEPPGLFLPNAQRNIAVNNDGEILYTGFTGGVEYMW
jgi:hypothetical protein